MAQAQLKTKSNYHHGNLKDALIETALNLLETHSPDQISLRRLARDIGVSQTAVYSHFKDKTDMMAAIAIDGFQRQAQFMADAVRDQRDAFLRAEGLAVAYMEFAFENRALFQVMFSRDIQDLSEHKELALAAGRPYSLFAAAWTRFNPKQSHQMPFIWSMFHGQTMLMLDPKFRPAISRGLSPQELARRSIDIYKNG